MTEHIELTPTRCKCWAVAKYGHEVTCPMRIAEDEALGVFRRLLADIHEPEEDTDLEDPRCD